ncbi:MAG TPA: colicin E3/pyocin S6 family cytotoxin [Candidatus Babeliales bacterium]|nr:colicin E3/pyocin S6 family cytotoxin [Candidatus Babeliales bacterium]
MKQNNWQLSLVNFLISYLSSLLICPILNSVTQIPHFGPQTTINSARYYRPDNFNRIYNNRRTCANYSPTTSSTTAPSSDTNTNYSSKFGSQNLQNYPDSYNPFVQGGLSEIYYNLRTFLSSRYRETQETKYPYLAKQRREREQRADLQRAARAQAAKQMIALKLVRDYNRRLDNLKPASISASQLAQTQLSELHQYQFKIPEQFCNAKFNNPEQQWLHTQQLDIVCELADREIFPKNTVGLQDFSDTVLETVSLAHQANCQNLINVTKSLTDLAQDFLALGKGLIQGGYNFAQHVTHAAGNLILHPINTTKAVANNIANLTKNVTLGLVKTMVLLLDFDPEYAELKSHMSALHDYSSEHYQQFQNYVETVPRLQKLEQIGEFVGEQTLNLAANFLTGKAVSVISDSVIAAQLHKAMTVKKQADKAKPGKVTWLNKFGAPGKDVARTLGLVVTEEYELVELNGLVVSFKNNPANNNQTLFNHAEEYFKHNQSGKKSKRVSGAVKPANSASQKVRIVNTMPKQEFFKKPEILQDYQKIGSDDIWRRKPKTNGISNAEFLEWDDLHLEVEAYDRGGDHLGAIDPKTNKIYKHAVKGRKLKKR